MEKREAAGKAIEFHKDAEKLRNSISSLPSLDNNIKLMNSAAGLERQSIAAHIKASGAVIHNSREIAKWSQHEASSAQHGISGKSTADLLKEARASNIFADAVEIWHQTINLNQPTIASLRVTAEICSREGGPMKFPPNALRPVNPELLAEAAKLYKQVFQLENVQAVDEATDDAFYVEYVTLRHEVPLPEGDQNCKALWDNNPYASHGVDVTKKFLKTPNLENHWSTQYLPIHLSCLGIPIAEKISIAHEAVAKITPMKHFLFGKYFPFPGLGPRKCTPMRLDSRSLIFFPNMGIK